MSAYHKCIICGKSLENTSNEAFLLAQANKISSNYDEEESRVSFDSSRKMLICKECIYNTIILKKYPNLKFPTTITSYLKFYVRDGEVYLGLKPNKIITEKSTQEDVDNLVIEVTKTLLKGTK